MHCSLFKEDITDAAKSWASCPCPNSPGFVLDEASGKCFMKDRVGRRLDNARANCANFSAVLASVDDSESIARVQGIL